VTLSAQGVLGDQGVLAATVPTVTLAATGVLGDVGVLAATVPTVTLAATGEVGIYGALSSTVPTVTLAATGTVSSSGITVDYVDNYSQVGDGSTTTWTATGIGIGAADSNRVVVAIVYLNGEGTASISSVTIGGNAMTQLAFTQGDNASHCAIGVYYRAVATGTTADIVVNTSRIIDHRFSIDTFALSGTAIAAVSGTDYTASAAAWDATFTTAITTGQAALFVVAGAEPGGQADTSTWTGATKENWIAPGNYHYHSVGSYVATADDASYDAVVDDGATNYSSYGHGQVYVIFGPA
jgi:hypothetical protein